MNQDELYIYNYIKQKINNSLIEGTNASDYQVQRLYDSFYDKTLDRNAIIKKIDDSFNNLKVDFKNEELIGINFKNVGINLSLQEVDLLNIVGAKNINDLINICNSITNTKIKISSFNINVNKMSSFEFEEVQKKCFKLYKNSLLDLNYSKTDKGNIELLNNRLDYLLQRATFTNIEHSDLMEIIKFSKNLDEIPVLLNKKFGKDKTTEILNLLKNFDPVESIGLLDSTFDEFKMLYRYVHLFNSVSFNNEFSYGRICNADGTYHFDRILKCLNFAKEHNLRVTVGGLINFKDYPSSLYNSTSSSLVYDKLFNYVDNITKFLNNYNEENNIIDRVIILEDLLENDEPYRYRGLCSSVVEKGWTDKLTLTQIINICYLAKNNLKNVIFVYNENNLINKDKRSALYRIIETIKLSRKKIFDSIGIKLHISSNSTLEELTSMLEDINVLGFRIDITEYSMHIKEEYISTHTEEEIYNFKLEKYKEMYKIFSSYLNDIDSFTIHSISNKMDYYRFNKYNLDNYYGGYFGEGMLLISKLKFNSNISSSNYLIYSDDNKSSIKEYIDRALAKEIKILGFTKRISNNKYYNDIDTISYDEFNNFIKEIKLTKITYADLKIYAGIISDYEVLNTDYLMECKNKSDYMILDAKIDKVSLNTPLEYAKKISEAIETGIYDLVANPDKFMLFRDNFNDKDYNIYMENCKKASEIICDAVKKNNVPLCFDLNYNIRKKLYKDKEWGMCHNLFWNVVKERNILTIFSNSLSDPSTLDSMEDNINNAKEKIDISSLNVAGSKFDLVLNRKNNKLLNKKLEETNSKYHSFEYYYVKKIIDNSNNILEDLNKVKDNLNGKKEEEIFVNAISYYEPKNKDNLNNILKLIERKYNNREISKMHKTGYTYTIGVVGIIAITALITCLMIIFAIK